MSRSFFIAMCLTFLCAFSLFAEEFRVSQVQIEGNRRVATAAIRGAISINPGDVVTYEQVDANVRNIYALGGFYNITARVDVVQGSNILIFALQELPLVRTLEFRGNKKLSDQKLRDRNNLRPPFIFDHNRVRSSVQELKNAYIKDGYHAVQIDTQMITDGRGEATLVYQIDEGRKIRIRNIDFVGNDVLSKRALLKNMETKERWFLSWLTGRGVFLEEAMELDVERIKMAYYDIGHQDVIVQQPVVTLVEDRYLNIEIEIDEGPQYRVGNVSVSGDMLYPENQLLEQVKLQEGEVFSRLELRESIVALTDLYADSGYAYVNVVPLTTKRSEELLFDIELEIEQGVQVSIERVDISGNVRTRDKVIRRQIPVIEGELYSSSKLKEANRRIRNLGFFEEVQITDRPGSAEDLSVVEVAVDERLTGTFSIGLGYSSVDKLMAQGSITQENFLGRGLDVSLSGSIGSKSTTYSLAVTDPYFLDTEWTLGGEVYRSQREYRDYDDYRTGGAIRAGHPVSRNSRVFLTYRYEQKEIRNLSAVALNNPFIVEQAGTSTLSSITTQWVRNSTDFFEDPSRGGVTRISLEYAGLGGTEHFLRPIASHRHFFPLFWGTVFSAHGEIGYITSTRDDDVSLSERFFLGGIRTIRGFKTREVGPQEGNVFVGGEKMAYLNLEYLFPIYRPLGLQGVIFYDTGNAWRDSEDYFSDMRHSAGAGIRWRSPLGPLRFEWGYNLSPRDNERKSVFEFTIGRPF